MPLTYLLDEHLRGPLWRAIQRHNALGTDPLDAVRVGDVEDLPLGSLDPDILLWSERAGRVIVSHDGSTLPTHLTDHLHAGNHCPGIFIVKRRTSIPQVIEWLVEAAYHSDPSSWRDRYEYIP